MIHARDHANSQDTGRFRKSCGSRGEGLGWQSVSDDRDFRGREADGKEAIGGGLRVADNGIAAAKSGGLHAELRGGHQVSQLAMAADYDGDAGEPGSGMSVRLE